MHTIATLHQLRQRFGLAAADTADDPRLLAALQAASARIERGARRRFTPRLAALKHTVTHSRELLLSDDLLELGALTNGDGASIPPGDVLRLPGDGPAGALQLTEGHVFVWTDSPVQAVTVTGVWGWHDDWASAWRFSADTVQNNPLSSSGTTLTVASASGADAAAETPRFQVGHLLKIESEYLRVLAISGNQLSVQRGVSGTTAAAHAQNTPIFTYQPPADALSLTLRWAAWLVREADAPGAPPFDLADAVAALRRVGVRAV